MKTRKIYLLLLLLLMPQLASSQCEILLWEENFDGTEVNTETWNIAYDNLGGGNNELQYYTPRAENVYIEDGNLVLKALKENFEDRIFTSGKITTKNHFDFKYGRIEGSMKLAEGQGMWPAFWMLPAENVYGSWPNSGEIDIMELVGHEPNIVWGTLHIGPPWFYTNGSDTLETGNFSDDFHKFSIEWFEDSIKWYRDDILYSMKTKDDLTKPEQWNRYQERFYLILNLAVGGDWPGPPNATTVFPQTMMVDYVRVYGDPAVQEIRALGTAYPNAKNVSYTFPNIPGATFNWTLPTGVTAVAGEGTHEITVDWGCDPGTISLDVSSLSCDDQHYDLAVTFDEITIAGDTTLFQLEPAVYSIPELEGTTYTWEYPDGSVIEGTPDDSLIITWGCDAGYVKVDIFNACMSDRDSVYVELTEPLFTGPTNVSQYAAGMVYNITEQPSCTYDWSVPTGATIMSGQGSNEIEVDFGTQGGEIAVEITNSCGSTTYSIPLNISDTIIIADYETTFVEFLTFSGSTFNLASNQFKDAVNSSDNIAETFKSEVTWCGIYADLGYELRFINHKKFSMKVYGPKTGNVLFKIEDLVDKSEAPIEVSTPLTKVNEWEELVFEFPDAEDASYDRLALFFDFGSADINTYYFDDILLLPTETGIPSDKTDKGVNVWPNPFTDYIMVNVPYTSGSYDLTVYDMQGRVLMNVPGNQANGSEQQFRITDLEKGIYLLTVTHAKETFSTLISKE